MKCRYIFSLHKTEGLRPSGVPLAGGVSVTELRVIISRLARPRDENVVQWRRYTHNPLLVFSTRFFSSLNDKGQVSSSLCRQAWYQRQLRAQILFPLDLVPLALRSHYRTRGPFPVERASLPAKEDQYNFMADIFLGCCRSPLCEGDALLSVFRQLSGEHQCSILIEAAGDERRYSRLPLFQYTTEALNGSSFSPRHCKRLVNSLTTAADTPLLPWVSLLQRVFSTVPSLFSGHDEARAFLSRILSLMETHQVPDDSIAKTLAGCGLLYEACAYSSSSASLVTPPPVLNADAGGPGYGELMHCICALPKVPTQWFAELCRGMPPSLRRYSSLIVLRSEVEKGGIADVDGKARWRTFAQEFLTVLEAASALHFLFGMGEEATARELLPYCHSQRQIATLMRYTNRVSSALALAALKRSVELRAGDFSIVHLFLTHRLARKDMHLIFWAQQDTATPPSPHKKFTADDALMEVFSNTFSLGLFDRETMQKVFHGVMPRTALVKGTRPLSHLLSAVPPSAVERIMLSLTPINSDGVSWWASLYVEAGNLEGALAVLEAMAIRKCLPHMSTIVGLLEAVGDHDEYLPRVAALLGDFLAPVSRAVLRAYAERAAVLLSESNRDPLAGLSTLRALGKLSVEVAARLSSAGAAAGKPNSAHAVRKSVRTLPEVPLDGDMPIALSITTIHDLATACLQLDCTVAVRVTVRSEDCATDASWASTVPNSDGMG